MDSFYTGFTVGRPGLDFTGHKFNKITITHLDPNCLPKYRYWLGVCECGNSVRISPQHIQEGKQVGCRSCGLKACSRHRRFIGVRDLRQIWRLMIRRCYVKHDSTYSYYGARGIRVCVKWRHDFWAFVKDMGPREKGYSLERIDNNGNYTPTNCKWLLRRYQSKNRCTSVKVSIAGETKILSDWLREYGMSFECYYARRKVGMSKKKAITTPKQVKGPPNQGNKRLLNFS